MTNIKSFRSIKNKDMYKEGVKYKLVGFRPVGINYNIPRVEIAEWKNGFWYPYGRGKQIMNFVIEEVVEL